jgi:ubiquinone/menaquinone biosynthesis C-methylase UbiE
MLTEAERQQGALRAFVRSGGPATRVYGLEWGNPRRDPIQAEVLRRFLLPFLSPPGTVLEIGAGGGRWTREMAGRAVRLILVDGVPEFEAAIRQHLPDLDATFLVAPEGRLPDIPDESVDFVFSFDTFVHFHRPLFDTYVETAGRVLRPGGHFVLHHARHYPGCEHGPSCFQYRDEPDVNAVLVRNRLHEIIGYPIPCGLGSRVVLARRVGSLPDSGG